MKRRSNVLCLLAAACCLTAVLFLSVLLQPKQTAPQTLLTESQQEELLRFPKSILEATEEDLMLLDGIGRVKAREIRSYLQTHSIQSMEQLLEVDGVGEDTLKDLKKYFYLF